MQVREQEQIRQDEAAAHSYDEARVSHAKTSQLQLSELPPLGILTTKNAMWISEGIQAVALSWVWSWC